MSKGKTILLRVQSADGTKRIEISPKATAADLFAEIEKSFKSEPGSFSLYKERNCTAEVTSKRSQTINSLNLKHGDMLYVRPSGASTSRKRTEVHSAPPAINSTYISNAKIPSNNKEDEVDVILSKMDGRIERTMDPKLCRHNSNGRCVHCSQIEPWDEAYLKEHKIKHLSFHAYIRKLTSGVDRGKFVALENLNCRIKSGCTDHPPWPRGICSKCQPSAITLNRQTYRHVDNVMFENTALVERFLNFWRTTGYQRLGYLYGTYEQHTDVPLGIRARVAAIYEPPQECAQNSIKFLPDEAEAEVNELAAALGLQKVGWIFTDLLSDNVAQGTVKQVRGIETHFLTANECIVAGQHQNDHPNVTKYAPSGTFGSKFVTVCVTGDAKKQIHMEGYAVSAQCMALVKENILVPTKDAPELGYIRESTDKQFVPDVYYKEKDQYGNEVSRLARPLPVEYLLVDVPASTPLNPLYTFTARDNINPFPIENRYIDSQLQDFQAVCTYLSQWQSHEFLDSISDFHFLLYCLRMDMLPIKATIGPLLEAIRNRDNVKAMEWKQQETWTTLESLITASGGSMAGNNQFGSSGHSGNGAIGGISAGPMEDWTCKYCTFMNGGQLDICEMCSLPRE